jgi:D-3-phosphoglycerate dehydrogenase
VTFISYEGRPEVREHHIAEADAVIGDVPDALLSRAARLRWVQTTGAGANAVCTPGMIARDDIIGTSCVGVHVASVPEQTLAMLLAFARRLPEQIVNQHTAHRFYWPTGMFEVEGQTMGILGLGNIGLALARKAKGLGCASPAGGVRERPRWRGSSIGSSPPTTSTASSPTPTMSSSACR